MFRKCHVLSTLKTPCNSLFLMVSRRPVTRLNFPPLSNPQFFHWQSKNPSLTGPLLTVYILIYCLTCFRPEYAWNICYWTLNNNQSINQYYIIWKKVIQGSLKLFNFFWEKLSMEINDLEDFTIIPKSYKDSFLGFFQQLNKVFLTLKNRLLDFCKICKIPLKKSPINLTNY